MPTFQSSPDASVDGTYHLADVQLSPAALVKRFGRPGPGDLTKVSGEYTFRDDRGNVFTLYDWKCTSVWEVADGYVEEGEEPSFPTPDEFWSSDEPVTLNVGGTEGRGDLQAFIRWLQAGGK